MQFNGLKTIGNGSYVTYILWKFIEFDWHLNANKIRHTTLLQQQQKPIVQGI